MVAGQPVQSRLVAGQLLPELDQEQLPGLGVSDPPRDLTADERDWAGDHWKDGGPKDRRSVAAFLEHLADCWPLLKQKMQTAVQKSRPPWNTTSPSIHSDGDLRTGCHRTPGNFPTDLQPAAGTYWVIVFMAKLQGSPAREFSK